MPTEQILFVDDDAAFRAILSETLVQAGYTVTAVAQYGEAVTALKRRNFDLAIVDLHLEGSQLFADPDGEILLDDLWSQGVLAVVVTGYPGSHEEQRMRIERHGGIVYEMVDKKRFDPSGVYLHGEFLHVVRTALEAMQCIRESEGLTAVQQQRLQSLGS